MVSNGVDRSKEQRKCKTLGCQETTRGSHEFSYTRGGQLSECIYVFSLDNLLDFKIIVPLHSLLSKPTSEKKTRTSSAISFLLRLVYQLIPRTLSINILLLICIQVPRHIVQSPTINN
jgi:hypothetical protein